MQNGHTESPSGVLAGGQGDRQRVRKECRTDTPSVLQECLQVVREIGNRSLRFHSYLPRPSLEGSVPRCKNNSISCNSCLASGYWSRSICQQMLVVGS